MLNELPFYDELNIIKTAKAFKRYARSYCIELIMDKDGNINDALVQLEASKSVIKDLFRDLSIEMKGFKYQGTLKVKQNKNGDKEFDTVYFSSTAKIVINLKYGLDKSFQHFFYRLDNQINEGSACTIEYIDGEYVNISIYSPLSGSTYIELPDKLKNSMKGFINIKNDDKCFLWCHIRHLNPLKTHPERITVDSG